MSKRLFPSNDRAVAQDTGLVDGYSLASGRTMFNDHGAEGASQNQHNRSLSMSLPWCRPKPSMLFNGDVRDLPQQLTDLAVDDDTLDTNKENFRPRGLSQGHNPHHSSGVRGIIRKASMSLRGMVHRRSSMVTAEPIDERHASLSSRPTTASSAWNYLRHPGGLRQSRSFYGLDLTQEPLPISADRPTHSSYLVRPGLGGEPPFIPINTGGAAKASAALQNEYFARQNLHTRWLHANSSEDGNDRESGIGIAATIPSSEDTDISKIDFITKLPTELAIHVLAYLDAATLSRACRVSKEWNKVVHNQHIWRESCLRETSASYATSGPVQPNKGLGVPQVHPSSDWKEIYRVKKQLERRWKGGKARTVYLHGHTDSIYCLQFDEYKIITGSRDKTIRVWDLHTFECKVVIGPPEIQDNAEITIDIDGQPAHYAAGSDDERLAVSNPTILSFPTHHKASILCLQYDDKILATGSSDASCIIYDIRAGYRPIRRLQNHTAAVLDLTFDEKYIITCSKDISICVWDRHTGALIRRLRGHEGPVNAVQMRGNTIVSCSGDARVKLWNIDTGKNIREFVGHTKGLACSQFSEDGRYVASAGNDKTIRIWDANTGECVREVRAHENLVRSLHIDSVSGRLISGSYDRDIKVWDMETGQPLLDFPQWHASWVLSAKSDYRRIVSTGQDPKILIMDFGADVKGIELLESADPANRDGEFI